MNKFQAILLFLFGAGIIAGVITVMSVRSSSTYEQLPMIHIWGIAPKQQFDAYIQSVRDSLRQEIKVTYTEHRKDVFDQTLLEAFAEGNAPDAVFMSHDMVERWAPKIYELPYSAISARAYSDAFIDAASVYMTPTGVRALPLGSDPLVMYWNKKAFAEKFIVNPPKYWEEFRGLAEKLSSRSADGVLQKSMMGFGEYRNVKNAQGILSTLAMQAGTSIVEENGAFLSSAVMKRYDKPRTPMETALDFYTSFADPTKPQYSWSRSRPEAREYFASGASAMYFGYASEYEEIRAKNPNLVFDAALMPQGKEGTDTAVFSRLYGISVLSSSAHISDAFTIAGLLTSPEFAPKFASITRTAPARKSLVSEPPAEDPIASVVYKSAAIAKVWPDPDWKASERIFAEMIEGVTAWGGTSLPEIISNADALMQSSINKLQKKSQ